MTDFEKQMFLATLKGWLSNKYSVMGNPSDTAKAACKGHPKPTLADYGRSIKINFLQ